MRKVKLEFTSAKERDLLLADPIFEHEIAYLHPEIADPNGLILFDPVEQHFSLDTEAVILTLFARGFKRLIFPTTTYAIEFIVPFANEKKIGIRHNRQILIAGNQIQL